MPSAEVKARVALDLDADPHVVFAAHSSMIERWLFKSPTNMLEAQTDPRAGGAFSIVEHDRSEVITHDGRYAICEAPTRLSFTLAVPQHFAGLAQIDVTITPRGRGSHLDFQAGGGGPPDAQQLWEKMIANLAQVLKVR